MNAFHGSGSAVIDIENKHNNDDEFPRITSIAEYTDNNNDDDCSIESGVPSVARSTSDSSEGSSSNDDVVSPLNCLTSQRVLLRQRNSGLDAFDASPPDSSSLPPSSASTAINNYNSSNNNNSHINISSSVGGVVSSVVPQFLLPQNMSVPIPKGPVRKHSDFEQSPYKELEVEYYNPPKKSNNNNKNNNNNNIYEFSNEPESAERGIGRFRTREEIVVHFMAELIMLRRDLAVIFCGLLFQWFHSVFTNIAYYYHTQLTAAQRVPLKDIAYETLPLLEGSWWMVSEYLVFFMVAVIVVSVTSILFIRWHPPHGRPLYCIPIVRRMLMTLTCCQVLRCISFLITTLPGASRQCLYDVPEDMSKEELLYGPAHDRGNPNGWAPPITMNDILWRVDAANGCGDLMFSSHTIFTMLFVCVIWRYFNWGFLKWAMLTMQLIIVPFILAAHKHYSVDVFTALYVTPLVFQVLKIKYRDLDIHSSDMSSHYGIRFQRCYMDPPNEDTLAVIMNLRGGTYYVDPADIPLDLQKVYFGSSYTKFGVYSDNDVDLEAFEEEFEFDPVIL